MNRDGHVRLLPLLVANKIAAGEVVERPASVLKELIENAIDAGATRIEITVTAGGRKLVSVRDNGCGMSKEDALLSLERQATSKIRDVDDIERIDTLGFRGEAIPSIASVSRFTMTTRTKDSDSGTRITVNAGVLAEVAECGAPVGTTVEVRELFCNVPARRKFLRSFATEESHIKNIFTVNSLAHPNIGFSLNIDGREIYNFAPGANLTERIHDIFGSDFIERLIPFKSSEEYSVQAEGFIERPDACEFIRHDQFVFVNGRPAQDASISYAVREACPRLHENSRPSLILFISLPPTQVDVNVHPAKREVRFRKPRDVRESVINAISSALTPCQCKEAEENLLFKEEVSVNTLAPFSSPTEVRNTYTPKVESYEPSPIVEEPIIPEPSVPQVKEEPPFLRSAYGPWAWFTYIGQTEKGFVILETDAGIVTLNPRAAMERIAYEELLESTQSLSQQLLIPETVQLHPGDSARIKNFKAELEKIGFVIEEFGKDVWKVDAVPSIINDTPVSAILTSIASDIAEGGARRGGTRWKEELIAKSVAKSHAGAMPKLTQETAVALVNKLASSRMPYTDPRNKPVMIFTSFRELDRKFNITQ
jgi:DNA mismatch repair protein MutL